MTKPRSNSYREVREYTFKTTTKWIRILGALPSREQILERANTNALIARGSNVVSLAEMAEIASGVTKSIVEGYDQSKVRPRPETSRSDRALADAIVINEYERLRREGNAPSCRQLAELTGRSKSAVSRILAKVLPKAPPNELKGLGPALFLSLRDILPSTGRRLVHIWDLATAIDRPTDDATLSEITAAALDINESKCGLQVIVIDDDTLFVSQGRRWSVDDATTWANKAASQRSQQRNSYVLSATKYAVPNDRSGLTRVARDLMSVVDVVRDPISTDNWKDFVAATVNIALPSDGDTLAHLSFPDHHAILKIIDAGRRVEGPFENKMAEVVSWFRDTDAKRALQKLLELREKLIDHINDLEEEELIKWKGPVPYSDSTSDLALSVTQQDEAIIKKYIELTSYDWKVQAGMIYGRNLSDVRKVLSAYEFACFDTRTAREIVFDEMSI